jgi:hypothetical protein
VSGPAIPARKFMPENRLAKVVDDSNGVLFSHALQKAAQSIEGLRPAHLAALEKKLDELNLRAAAAAGSRDPAEAAELYRLAREILNDAGAFKLKDISRAAHSLCELMASAQNRKQFWAGVAIHIDAINALRRNCANDNSRGVMLAGLEAISRGNA